MRQLRLFINPVRRTIALFLFWTYTMTRIGKDRIGHQKQPVYIYELNEYNMAHYIIFRYFHIYFLGFINGTRRFGYAEEHVHIFLHPEDDAAGCRPLLLLMVYQRMRSSCFVNEQDI